MSTIQTRVSEAEKELIQKFAEINNITVSDLIRNTILEKIEDEIDIDIYQKSMKAFEKDPETLTHDQVKKALGL